MLMTFLNNYKWYKDIILRIIQKSKPNQPSNQPNKQNILQKELHWFFFLKTVNFWKNYRIHLKKIL